MAPVIRHTRFVSLSKRFLWFLSGIIIAVVVWIASDNSAVNGARMVFSNIPKSGTLQNIMLKPDFRGVDAKNRPYTVVAEEGTQLDAQTITMSKVRADMTLENGWIAMNSGEGRLNTQTKQLELTGGVDLFYAGGYEFRSDHAQVDIQKGSAHGDAPVEGQGPPGTLTADSFSAEDHGKVLKFNGSVRMLLYR